MPKHETNDMGATFLESGVANCVREIAFFQDPCPRHLLATVLRSELSVAIFVDLLQKARVYRRVVARLDSDRRVIVWCGQWHVWQ